MKVCNREVRRSYGPLSQRVELGPQVGVVVCTFENANKHVNRLIDQQQLGRIACVVVDELHMVRFGNFMAACCSHPRCNTRQSYTEQGRSEQHQTQIRVDDSLHLTYSAAHSFTWSPKNRCCSVCHLHHGPEYCADHKHAGTESSMCPSTTVNLATVGGRSVTGLRVGAHADEAAVPDVCTQRGASLTRSSGIFWRLKLMCCCAGVIYPVQPALQGCSYLTNLHMLLHHLHNEITPSQH